MLPPPPTLQALRGAVTGAAAAALAPDGQIRLTAAVADGGERELTATEAGAIAAAWLRDYAPMARAWLEKTHGAGIDFAALSSCGRALYAHSAFNAPPEVLPGPYRRVYGPWWLLTFCEGSAAPTVSVAVSAWATELTMEGGALRFPRISGNEIVGVGIPVGHVGEYPSAPEAAIEMAAEETGRRVAAVPDLVTPLASDGPPQLARWRLTLDGSFAARTPSGERTVNEVFIGPPGVGGREVAISTAALKQPAALTLEWRPLPNPGESEAAYTARATRQTASIERRADTPARVEFISVRGQ